MDWVTKGNSNYILTKSTSDSLLKRSVSTINLSTAKTDLCLREARSLAGALEEYRYTDSCTETDNCQVQEYLKLTIIVIFLSVCKADFQCFHD